MLTEFAAALRSRKNGNLFVPVSLLALMLAPPYVAHGQTGEGGFVAAPSSSYAALSTGSHSSEALPEAPSATVAEDHAANQAGNASAEPVSIKGFPRRLLFDELHVLSSPAHIRKGDLRWLVPLAAATAVSFGTDTKTMTEVVSQNPSFNQSNATASDALRDTFIGVPVGLFVLGEAVHNDRAREAGLLSGEAIIDAYLFGELVKVATFRERPYLDNGRGAFYQRSAGLDSSFPSGHATVAWSSAAVLAAEYHSPWQQISLYTLASGVSLTRVLGQQHFPSDVLIGSASGWLIGHYVYRAHHRRSER